MVTSALTVCLLALAAASTAAWILLLLRERGIRPMRDVVRMVRELPPLGRAVVPALFVVTWLAASTKPGGGTNNVPQMLPPGGVNVANVGMLPMASTNAQSHGSIQLGTGNIGNWQQFHNGNIPRGNNSTLATLTTSTNAVLCADWLAFGGFEDWTYVPSGTWCFRFGTNFAERLVAFSSGEFRLVAGDASNRVSVLGLPVSMAPAANWNLLPGGAESLFWHSETPSNTLLLTWRNALLLRDAAKPVSAQAELHPDGAVDLRYDFSALPDLSVLSNAAAVAWRGDAAETVSLQTGQVAAVSFPAPDMPETDGLEDVFPRIELGNSNAYYFAEVSVAKGPSVVRVYGDDASALGGYSFVANPGETNAIPLLIGVKYRVSSEAAFSRFEPSSAAAVVSNVTDRLVEVEWPVSFSLQEIAETEGATTYRLAVNPEFLGGVVTWSGAAPPMRGGEPSGGGACSCECSTFSNDTVTVSKSCACSSCPVAGEYEYEGHVEPFSLDLKDYAPNGGSSGGGDDPDPEDPDEPESGPTVSMSFSDPVVLIEDAYESALGETHSRRSTETTLTVAVSGNRYGGMLTMTSQNFGKLENASGGGAVQLASPIVLAAGETYSRDYVCKGVSASGAENDVTVSATFVENMSGEDCEGAASATVVKIEIKETDFAIGNPYSHRRVYGIAEEVECRQTPLTPALQWSTTGTGYFSVGQQGMVFSCPMTAEATAIHAEYSDASLVTALSVIEPSGLLCDEVVFLPATNATTGCGMKLKLIVEPRAVSFSKLKMQEVPADLGNWQEWGSHSGYFADMLWYNYWCHTTQMGAGVWRVIGANNFYTWDSSRIGPWTQPWSDGALSWKIPYGWKHSDSTSSICVGQISPPSYSVWTMSTNFIEKTKHSHRIGLSADGQMYLDGVLQNDD